MIDLILKNPSVALMILTALCIVVSVITELFKPLIKSCMPTELFVIILSLVLSLVCYTATCSYVNVFFVWYEAVASLIVGFLISFITMYGWDKFFDIVTKYKRFLK